MWRTEAEGVGWCVYLRKAEQTSHFICLTGVSNPAIKNPLKMVGQWRGRARVGGGAINFGCKKTPHVQRNYRTAQKKNQSTVHTKVRHQVWIDWLADGIDELGGGQTLLLPLHFEFMPTAPYKQKEYKEWFQNTEWIDGIMYSVSLSMKLTAMPSMRCTCVSVRMCAPVPKHISNCS